MAGKKSAVDRVIEKLEAEREEIARTIARLREAQAGAATKRTRKPKAAAVEAAK